MRAPEDRLEISTGELKVSVVTSGYIYQEAT